jgi:murein DD-endopeptidase MepM/ murein hydrolase activator NlpD
VDLLRRKLYIESKSQDEVVSLAEQKEKLYAAIPAIQPISNKQLLALSSGYGWRTHPIYKVKKMHPGIDFAASIGTPIYATADGTVDQVSVKFSGYGKMVEINHGFGYVPVNAHMHGFAVRSGQSVKRGRPYWLCWKYGYVHRSSPLIMKCLSTVSTSIRFTISITTFLS